MAGVSCTLSYVKPPRFRYGAYDIRVFYRWPGKGSAVRKVVKPALAVVAVALALILIAVGIIYFWPHQSDELQAGTPETVSYDTALERVAVQQ